MSQIFSGGSGGGSESVLFVGLKVEKAEDLWELLCQRVNVPCSGLV